ncbi:hypothetical protein PILCRDRAFT_821553 [Piloderma croceum F 1598]|uniref:Uncharacterized protein n=1 Tax=Piloderma croceum (strain F 1598) TaxID=765440 RepID=A0A0C3F9X5_PILCF|nr:hypothetical protein PILCRDRAFT_821553 [Piloderma croceum F 1598]
MDSTKASGWPVEPTGILYEVGINRRAHNTRPDLSFDDFTLEANITDTGVTSPTGYIANYVRVSNVAVHEELRRSSTVINFSGPIFTSMNVSWDSPLLILLLFSHYERRLSTHAISIFTSLLLAVNANYWS